MKKTERTPLKRSSADMIKRQHPTKKGRPSRQSETPRKTSSQEKVDGELVFGVHSIVELLRAKRRKLMSIYTTKPTPRGWQQIEALLPARGVAIQYVPREKLHEIAGTTDHQGIVAWAHPFPTRKVPFDPKRQPFLIMLDAIQDPRNLGAIIRSAYCTGVSGVVLVKKNAAPLNATALKAAAGLAEHLEFFVAASTQEAAQLLTKAGYHLYIASFGGSDARSVPFTSPCCLVIGSEGPGITKGIERHGTVITLPQRTPDISYNASVAAGILLFLISSKVVQHNAQPAVSSDQQ
ncbi:23S rRNA (guanosine(2251)-2'-O)-methyltransferase RlmB [Candidatus Dependentiae bacterium]|nr:23S rRNA (guanosine(2251)-2'-O)-methyltransferase RlmB [Candidatus Dependentiae bacterium]MCC7414776.1 23S rRNA (guanosine(2251)-2'-O)-methyltransferase RlmB [Campylobacterota bacterium]